MKGTNIFRLIMASLLVVSGQSTIFAEDTIKTSAIAGMTAENEQVYAKAVAGTDLIVKNAEDIMYDARWHLFGVKNEDDKNVKIIIEQNAIIEEAKQKLKQLRDELTPKSYFSQFVAGIKKVGAAIAAPFTYTKPKSDKDSIIRGLRWQRNKVGDYYVEQREGLADKEQAQLSNRYNAIMEQFDDAIYERGVVIGDTSDNMSFGLRRIDFKPETDLTTAVAETESIVNIDTNIIDHARELLLKEKITNTQVRRNVIRIAERVESIVEARLKLKRLREKLVEKIEVNGSKQRYASQFAASAKSLEDKALGAFTGYGEYQKKDEARNAYAKEFYSHVVTLLNEQKTKIMEAYRARTPEAQAQLKEQYEASIALLNKYILDLLDQQKRSVPTLRKRALYKAGIMVGGAAVGAAAGNVIERKARQYFSGTSEIDPELQEKLESAE